MICPHLNTANFDGIVPDQNFLDGTMEMMRRCDLVVLLPGWGDSSGSIKEKSEADRLGTPTYGISLFL